MRLAASFVVGEIDEITSCRELLGLLGCQGRQVPADFPVSPDQGDSKVNLHSGGQERKARRENPACLEWMDLRAYLANQGCQV